MSVIPAIQSIQGKRLIFLVGAPRSGTTWLQILLSASPRCTTAAETHLFSAYLESAFRSWDAHAVQNIGLKYLMSETEFKSLMRRVADEVLGRIGAVNPNADIIIEKSPEHSRHWRSILALYPNAMFVHIIRDPRAVTASMLDAARDWGAGWAPKTAAKCAELWLRNVSDARMIADATTKYREVRYENLKANGPKILASLFEWIGVPMTEAGCTEIIERYNFKDLAANRIQKPWDAREPGDGCHRRDAGETRPDRFYRRGEAHGWQDELSTSQIAVVEALAGKEMRTLGYELTGARSINAWIAEIRAALRWRVERLANQL